MARIRVRARAVDMLGRQQIAGVPTAINELFKNAHDAYAQRVEADFFRADELLVVRDDGLGMTLDDFEGKWLTLGTESKLRANEAKDTWTGPRNLAVRPIMGEKGIGRLAIAAIGPQVLILTRAVRPDGLHPLVVSLIHWGLFEVPGIDVDSIEIPIEEVSQGKLPSLETVLRLSDKIKDNLEALGEKIPASVRQRIIDDLSKMQIDPSRIEHGLADLKLSGDGFGTHFYVRPTNSILIDDIDSSSEYSASPLQKMLLGFGNTMMASDSSFAISAEFRDHREDGTTNELISGDSFFTPDEFESADHHIEGRVDEFGNFEGSVSIYRNETKRHLIRWPSSTGRPTECGPFSIKFAYVQGKADQSLLPPDQWALLVRKLNQIGGLYVYRDGIRILPYGNSDYDFVNIEQRRTKSASDWYFSYRRLFGAVEITHRDNANLVEKAGREGFRVNRAYREFVAILENIFQRLAIDFFRESAVHGEAFKATRESLIKENALLKKREEMTRERRKDFAAKLNKFFEFLESGAPVARANELRETVATRLHSIKKIEDPEVASQELLAVESQARKLRDKLLQESSVTKPRDIGLTKTQLADWNAYLRNQEKLLREVYEPLRQDIDRLVNEVSQHTHANLERRRRVQASLLERRDRAKSEASRLRREVQDQVQSLTKTVDSTLGECSSMLSAEVERSLAELSHVDTSSLSDDDVEQVQLNLEARIDQVHLQVREELEGLRDQLSTLVEAVKNRETLDATTAVLESKAESLQEQLNAYIELAQIGMALGIVQHEFSSSVKKIRNAVRKLKPWADGTPQLCDLYKDLRVGFEHLDSYLNLFTPLSRRLYRKAIDLSGVEIKQYLLEVFDERLERNDIELSATHEFEQAIVRGFPSTFLPCFVNIVDNAIYWISTDSESHRAITLDADENTFIISNGGPGIEARIAERIFDFGESTKPGGRGMGMFLSREALRKEGFDIELRSSGASEHPVFAIFRRDGTPLYEGTESHA